MIPVGEKAPAFELRNQHGEEISLADFEGERVVVYFYPRAGTEGCTKQACGFRDSISQLEEFNTTVLGISDDPVSDLTEFAEEYNLPFHLLSDETGEVASKYDSYGEKNMFGNTFMGVFRNTYVIGPDGTIEHVYERVSPDGHAEEILEDLQGD